MSNIKCIFTLICTMNQSKHTCKLLWQSREFLQTNKGKCCNSKRLLCFPFKNIVLLKSSKQVNQHTRLAKSNRFVHRNLKSRPILLPFHTNAGVNETFRLCCGIFSPQRHCHPSSTYMQSTTKCILLNYVQVTITCVYALWTLSNAIYFTNNLRCVVGSKQNTNLKL